MSTILVTGAEGFIGSHLVERLLREGREVRAMALYDFQGARGWLGEIPPSPHLEIRSGDLRDSHFVREAVKGCSSIVHLAAHISIPYSYENPEAFFQTNTIGLLHLLQAARAEGVTRFLHTSTSEVYGSAKALPMDEAHPLNPQSPYAASKAAGDHLAMSFFCAYGLPITVVRPFNTFGPRQSPRAILPAILSQLLWSESLTLGNTHPSRDFLFVDDLVDGYCRLLEAAPFPTGEIFHFGTGVETTVIELLTLCQRVADRYLQIETSADRRRPTASEVDRLVCSAEKARQRLGWQPRVHLEEGVRETYQWLSRRAPAALYDPNRYYR